MPCTQPGNKGVFFRRVLSGDERNAVAQWLADQRGLGEIWPKPTSDVDIEALLQEAELIESE